MSKVHFRILRAPIDADCRVIRICYGTLLLINMLCLAPYLELWFTEVGPIPLAAARAILDPDAWIPFAWLPNSDSALTVWLSFTVMLYRSCV